MPGMLMVHSDKPLALAIMAGLTASVEPISAHAKVAAWKGMDAAAKSAYASPHGSVDAVKAALSFCGSEDLGDRALASNLATPNRFCEDDSNDDDDDDDDDLGLLLVSKRRRSEMVLSILTDSGGHTLNSERMAPLWRIFAWIPLDTLPEVYRRVHGIDLWTPETKKQIRASIKDLPGLSERTSMNGLSRQTMIIRDKCHLKQARAFQRLFAFTPVFEPVLFFYLVTTVLRPLELSQAKTIARLWTEEFGRGLTYAVTKKLDKGGNNTKWESDEAVWSAAVDWLCRLARVTVEHGLDCLTSKTTNWDNPGPQSRKGSQAARNDPESELVAGLRRDELTELLKAAPTLLSKIIPSNLIGLLRSELNL
ncbi:hypothetical protein GGH95_003536 [Coemansia sp. RSA 1836]|nr:hypothetical protein GGH95_003536 [Coemansia sp. RSA 1836]